MSVMSVMSALEGHRVRFRKKHLGVRNGIVGGIYVAWFSRVRIILGVVDCAVCLGTGRAFLGQA
jgi:hypothetical protein